MPQQSTVMHHGGGLCLLSLDAGGSRAISQLQILVRIMDKLTSNMPQTSINRPCGVFDMLGGTGSAGFIAILLVVLRLTAQQALDEYIDLCNNVLEKRGPDSGTRMTNLKGHIDNLLGRHGIKTGARLMDLNERLTECKLVVPISYRHSVGSTCTLRNFEVRHEQALNLTISQALLVTLATPPLFTPISVSKDAATFEYISGDLALSNPTRELISEAHGAFGPEQRVACLISLGCGHPGVIPAPKNADVASWNRFLEKLVLNSEQTAQSIDSQMEHLGIYFRLSVDVGSERKMTDYASAEIIAHTDVYLEDISVSQRIELCLDFLKIRDGIPSLEQLKYSGGERTLPPSLPPLTQNFVMRTKPWEFIEKILIVEEDRGTSRMLVVTGMGGCDKTQLILKFMQVHEERFSSMFFIDSSSKGRLRSDIVRHVRSLGPEHSQKTFEDCLLFLAQPSPNGRRLIIYDNVDDPDLELAPLLPQGSSCTIIITSRDRLIGGLSLGGHLELEEMSMDEAIELVLRTSGNPISTIEQDQGDARDISESLGCLPLALQQACSYMFQTKCSARTYLARLGTSRDKMLSMPLKNQLDNHSISTYAAFDASFDRLPLRTQQFLYLLAFFHWSNFPLELIFLAARHNFNDYETKYTDHSDSFQIGKALLNELFCRNGVWDPTITDEMTKSIQNYSLITLVSGVDTTLLQIHPLAHGWIRSCTPEQDRDKYQAAAVLLLALGARRETTPSAKYLSSHATYMSTVWHGLNANDAEAFARILTEGGLFNDALGLREMVVAELRNHLDTQSLLFSDSLWLLAVAYSNVGRFAEAQALQTQVMSLRKGVVQENDPTILETSISLANTYRILRQFDDAEALQIEVLRMRREALGDHNTATLTALNQLALTYSDSGRLEKAETLQVEALTLSKELRGDRHPDTLIASGDLANTYLKLWRPKEALPLQLEVVRLSKEVRGDRHPDTSKAMSQLAQIYSALGEFPDAETLQEEVQRLSKEIRGERHPVTIGASSSLATIYFQLGRFKEAEILQKEVLRLRKELLGERHLDTIDAAGDLAQTYLIMGRTEEGEWLQDEMWRRKKEILGEGHLDTIEAARKLSTTLVRSGRRYESTLIRRRLREVIKELPAGDHADHVAAQTRWLYESNSLRWERREWIDSWKWRTKHLGERHPETIYALRLVASDYRGIGRLSKAKHLQQKVLQLRKETSGDRNPETISAYSDLAVTYHYMGRLARAESIQLQVLTTLKETGRERHPDSIQARLRLAYIYYDFGRFEEALKLEEEVLALYKEVFGKDKQPIIQRRIQSGAVGKIRRVFWRGMSLAASIVDL